MVRFALVIPPSPQPTPPAPVDGRRVALLAAQLERRIDQVIARNRPWRQETELRSQHDHNQYRIPETQRRPGVEFSHHPGRVLRVC